MRCIERLRGLEVPTWGLGLLVALLTFPIAFGGPGGGLDSSWAGGLYMAVHDGMDFGTEVVYTYGPLGFLFSPQIWYDQLAVISFLFASLLWVALAFSLTWAIRRNLGAPAAVMISFAVLALLPSLEQALVITAVWSFAVLQPERPRWALEGLIVGAAAFAAIEILIKLSIGPVIVAIILAALVGARARPWQIGLFVGLFAVATTALWLLSGGTLGDLPDYVTNGREIISGYSEALAVPLGPAWQRLAALAALVAAAATGSYRDGLARWGGIAVAAIAGFAIFKEGVVRSDEGHMTIAMATMVALWLVLPWSQSRRLVLAGGFVALGVVALYVQPAVATHRLNPIDTVRAAETQFELLFSPSRREGASEYSRALLKSVYGLDEATLAELRGHTVSIDPWEITVAWTYDLDWSPVPIFQNYQAYTEKLDELNAAIIASPGGPERILRENPAAVQGNEGTRGVDGRYPSWDPPAQALATLCNFEPLRTTSRWQVLGRVPDRCGEPRMVGSVEASYGETVDVPQAAPGEVVFVRIDGAEVGGLEKLRTLLYRSHFRYAVIDGDASYRLVPGTAADGLLLDGSPRLTGAGPWAEAPGAETIALTGVDGDLRYDFFSMAVDAGATGRERG